MSTEQREFTPSREKDLAPILEMLGPTKPRVRFTFSWQNGVFAEDDGAGLYSASTVKREGVAVDRELDRDSCKLLILWWRSVDGFDMTRFEDAGRRFGRQLAVDNLAQLVGAPRGAALTAKPDEELRRKIALFQEQRRLIGEVASALTVYEKAYTPSVDRGDGGQVLVGATQEKAEEAEKALRELAGRLRASLWSVPASH